jgi:hypothetical protein
MHRRLHDMNESLKTTEVGCKKFRRRPAACSTIAARQPLASRK